MGVSKQLLPIYDKPMIYYPLSVLMLAGIQDILVITTPDDQKQFKRVLGDGSQWGIRLRYKQQLSPDGLAQAFLLAEEFLDGAPSVLILGDNIFFGHGLPEILFTADQRERGATVFGYHVTDPERYGVVGFDDAGSVNSIVEKPDQPASNYAITGLYFVDETAPDRAKQVQASKRGEMEITSVLDSYQKEGSLTVEKLGRGFAWLDTGTHNSLLDASNFVKTLTVRQGLQVGSPDEVAYKAQWVTKENLKSNSELFEKNEYGRYLLSLISDT
jgi:glucose-1-phosphate thymidylyltransferase